MTDDPAAGFVLAFGGLDSGTPTSDTLAYANGSWNNLTGTLFGLPPPRYGASLAYDPIDREAVLFGGCQTSSCYPALGDTWVFANNSWTELTGSGGPSDRPLRPWRGTTTTTSSSSSAVR